MDEIEQSEINEVGLFVFESLSQKSLSFTPKEEKSLESKSDGPHLWSHGCKQPKDGGDKEKEATRSVNLTESYFNAIQGCKMSLENGYEGIEVDVQWHDGQFYLTRDDWTKADETLSMLFEALQQHQPYSLWIDLKTKKADDVVLKDL